MKFWVLDQGKYKERDGLVVKASDSRFKGREFESHSGPLVSVNKAHLLPKSIGNTQEAVAPSKHDRNFFDWDFKNQINQRTRGKKSLSLTRKVRVDTKALYIRTSDHQIFKT